MLQLKKQWPFKYLYASKYWSFRKLNETILLLNKNQKFHFHINYSRTADAQFSNS